MLVLAIDTSSDYVVAATVNVADPPAAGWDAVSGNVLAERAEFAPRGHGESLAPSIVACLDEAGSTTADLGAVVAGVGPGPYTGLRVGLMTAAALGDALRIPTYGACSLDAVGNALAEDDGDVLVVTDARRKEVYWARYDGSGRRLTGPHVSRPGDVDTSGVSAIGGSAATLHQHIWPVGIDKVGLEPSYPRPAALVALARDRIQAGAPSEPLTPMYLRRPDAVVPGAPKRASQ